MTPTSVVRASAALPGGQAVPIDHPTTSSRLPAPSPARASCTGTPCTESTSVSSAILTTWAEVRVG